MCSLCICAQAGITVSEGAVQPEMLEHFVREELNRTAQRVMAVLHPLKIVLTNFPHLEVSTCIFVYLYMPFVTGLASRFAHSELLFDTVLPGTCACMLLKSCDCIHIS